MRDALRALVEAPDPDYEAIGLAFEQYSEAMRQYRTALRAYYYDLYCLSTPIR